MGISQNQFSSEQYPEHPTPLRPALDLGNIVTFPTLPEVGSPIGACDNLSEMVDAARNSEGLQILEFEA